MTLPLMLNLKICILVPNVQCSATQCTWKKNTYMYVDKYERLNNLWLCFLWKEIEHLFLKSYCFNYYQRKITDMENFEEQYCALCHSAVSNGNFKEIQNVTKDIFEILLLKLNFVDGTNHVMCNICSVKVTEAFKFKSMCIYTDNTIIPFVNDEAECLVDLREIYAEEKGRGILDDHKVCRLCMQLIKGEFVSMQEVHVDVFEKYIPEINLSVVQEPVLCSRCFSSVCTHSDFIKTCIKVEKVNNICGTASSTGHCELSVVPNIKTEIQIKAEPRAQEDDLSGTESIVVKSEYEDMLIKNECIDIKPESNSPPEISSYILENKYRPAMIREPEKKAIKQKKIIYKNHTPSNRCDTCGREYDKCDCETELEGNLKKLQFRYGSPSELQTYKCDTCEYESENKRNFTSHQLVHKDSTEVQMYKCDMCHFMSKYKCNRDRHQLKHSKHLGMEMYKCDLCKFKKNLKCHHLIHMNASKVQMYICSLCDFTTKFNNKFNNHQLKHGVRSEIYMYKCDLCDFKTKYKNTFNVHQLKHADPSEVQMYKCDLCDFKTKYKHILRIHKTKHLDTSNVRMYKCDLCDYESKYKFRLKFHKLKHTQPSQVQQFKCDSCDFTTKFNFRLTDHQLKHADPSEVPTYKCNLCQFKTKYKYSLRCHQLTHTDPSNVSMYKCDICNYETKHKCNFLRHKRLTHKTSSETQN